VKWVGRPDDPSENTYVLVSLGSIKCVLTFGLESWEREALFSSSEKAAEMLEKFWSTKPDPLSQPDDEGQYALGSMFEASTAYLGEYEWVEIFKQMAV
jgi:hypothetical protein